MTAAYPPHSPFPPALDAVPPEHRLTETFAFTPGALSIGGALGLAGFLIAFGTSGGPKSLDDMYLPGACAVGAVLFGAWEIVRRMQRTSLVFAGDQMGVYRGGQLAQVAYRRQITIYQLSVLNTVRELFAFGFLALILLPGAAFSLARDPATGLMMLGAGLGSAGAFASSVCARIACRHFFVPKGTGTEQVMFTRGELGRFGIGG